MVIFNPRQKQKEVLAYTGGTMGVSAVPGSGKTWTLSVLASKIISEGYLEPGQEVLIVTLVNSAVDNFASRISGFIQAGGMPFQLGYHVRTLHSLAHEIVRERPGLVGLADNFQIVDERESLRIRNEVATAWVKGHPHDLDRFLAPSLDENENKRDWVRREKLPELVNDIALGFIRYAKDNQLGPAQLSARMERLQAPLFLAEMGAELYKEYQDALNYRGAVDFDDLIRLALRAITLDADFLARLRYRWPYILEDEAQDSSLLQENILRELAGPGGNWVRVGDPNQAIFETFTTANPLHLREFVANQADFRRELPNSGRSSQSIIDLANQLIDWTLADHPNLGARDALGLPHIERTDPGDPQPNPENRPENVFLIEEGLSPKDELDYVANDVAEWLAEHPDKTLAVLVPRNTRGFQVVDALRQRGLDPVDSLLRSSATTRLAAGAIANILQYLSDPKSAHRLATIYKVWRREDREDETASDRLRMLTGWIEKLARAEDFIWPQPDRNWLQDLADNGASEEVLDHLADFRDMVRRWQGAVLLPIDQLVLTLAQYLFINSTELAIAHKLAVTLGGVVKNHQDWRLPEMTEELAVIARNERRFLGFSEDDSGFEPEKYAGRPVVATMHKAKGLEWDRVYLMAVNNYNFPSGEQFDSFISEKWFLRDSLNLQAEALAQIDALVSLSAPGWYQEGGATEQARVDYVRERLRLLYVGITRAREDLVITWNTGRRGELYPAIPLVGLQAFAKEQGYGPK